jgi:hypothetical protein
MRTNQGPTFGEKTACFLCDFWWLILIILILLIGGGLLARSLMPQPIVPTSTHTSAPTSTPEAQVLGTGDIQLTLRWDDLHDLDLSVTDPSGEVIYYGHPYSASNGVLDVDANQGCTEHITNHGVENIYWPEGKSPSGDFKVYVNLFMLCNSNSTSSDYTVTVLQNGVEKTFTGSATNIGQPVLITEFQNP